MNRFAKEKEALNKMITQLEDCMSEGRGKIFDLDAKEAYQDNKILRDACKLSLKLIDRATPKKSIEHHYEDTGEEPYIKYNCPNCNERTYPHVHFCNNCGQAIRSEDDRT